MIVGKLVLNNIHVIQEFKISGNNWLEIDFKLNERAINILKDSEEYDDIRFIITRKNCIYKNAVGGYDICSDCKTCKKESENK